MNTVAQRFSEFLAYAGSNPDIYILNNTNIVLTVSGIGVKAVELIDAGATSVSVRRDAIDTDDVDHFIAWADQVCGC